MIKKLFILSSLVSFYPSHSVQIIELTNNRWQEYKQLRNEVVENCQNQLGSTPQDALLIPDEQIKQRLSEAVDHNNRIYLFAQDDNGKLIGMVQAVKEWPTSSYLKHVVEIRCTYIVPEYRNQKIGTRLMEEVLAQLQADPTAHQALLWVRCDNLGAVSFYERMGFKVTGTLPRALLIDGTYHDAYMMTRPLK